MRKDKKNQTLTSEALSAFCSQMALIIGAGMMLRDGLDSLIESCTDADERALYESVREGLLETGSLCEALKQDSRWPRYLVEMTAVGEETGCLEEVMTGLADYYERDGRIHSAVVGAITYPLVLCGMLIVIVLVTLLKVLPVFRRVLSAMGVSAQDAGTRLMGISSAIGWTVLGLVVLAMLIVAGTLLLLRTKHAPRAMKFIRKVFPPMDRLQKQLAASRVASVMSMAISSGLPMENAISLAASVMADEESAGRVREISTQMEQGTTFADALAVSNMFDDLHARMIRMAIEAGRVDQVMRKLSQQYQEETEEGIANLISIIEPTLVALLSVVIGAILLSVMLPMAGILTTLM